MTKTCRSLAGAWTDALQIHFPDIIAEMGPRFTFHAFVKSLAKKYQHEYIDALTEYKSVDAPFRALHGELERRLHSNAGKYGICLVDSKKLSTDIFGSSSHCGEWEIS